MDRQELKIGWWTREGAFVGELVRFTGEKLGTFRNNNPELAAESHNPILTLYRCPPFGGNPSEPTYRILIEEPPTDNCPESYALLKPTVPEAQLGRKEDRPVYDRWPEESARRSYPELFSAVGMPPVRDLDELDREGLD